MNLEIPLKETTSWDSVFLGVMPSFPTYTSKKSGCLSGCPKPGGDLKTSVCVLQLLAARKRRKNKRIVVASGFMANLSRIPTTHYGYISIKYMYINIYTYVNIGRPPQWVVSLCMVSPENPPKEQGAPPKTTGPCCNSQV